VAAANITFGTVATAREYSLLKKRHSMQRQFDFWWVKRLEVLKKKFQDNTSRLIAVLGEAEVEFRRKEILLQITSQNKSQDEKQTAD
jgi:ribosomal protein L20